MDTSLKIALVTDFYYPILGGVSVHCADLKSALEKMGLSVTIITKSYKGYNIEKEDPKVFRVKIKVGNQRLAIPNSDMVKKILRKEKFDVVHCHHVLQPLSMLTAKYAKEMGKKVLITNHSIMWFRNEKKQLWGPISRIVYPKKYKEICEKVDHLIAVSNPAKQAFSYLCKKKVEVIPNGIYVDDFTPTKTKDYTKNKFLFVGRLSHRKGVHILIPAMNEFVKNHPDGKLKIIGPGYSLMKKFLHYRINRFKINKHIKFTGPLNRHQVIHELKKSTFYLMPSIWGESFGISLIEAFASKNACITSANGGLRELVQNGKTGLIAEPLYPKQVAENMEILANNPKLAKNMANNAFNYVQQYDWKNVARAIHKLYVK
ncbi:MAG: glycosyltransferase family 4 protein [Candidatus Hodarchaeales archaeon]